MALQNLGHKIVGACEIDKYARQVYARHFPNVKIWEDATKIKPEELPDFDILCAGFPCQSFSILGNRKGFDSAKGTLFFEIARIVRDKRPQIILLENVKGLLNHKKGNTFETIIKTLDELGYDVEWCVFDSKHFIPQVRKRVFIVGIIRTESRKQVFPIREAFKLHNDSQEERQMASAVIAGYAKRPSDGCYIIDGDKPRMFTELECERMQGLPDDYTKNIPFTQRYKMIGNAVTVPVVEFILNKLITTEFAKGDVD